MEVSGKKKDKSADVLCDLCLLLGKNTKAEHFCANCNEFFCDNCCMVHKVTRYTRNHKLLDSGNMPKQKLESYKDSLCSKHSGKGLKYICEDHNTIFCSICLTLDHKNCNLLFIDDIATDFDKTPEYKSLIDSIASLTKQLQEMKDKSIKKGEELQKSHGNFITDVKAFRKEINQILDTIEGTIIKEADDLKEDHLKLAVSDTAMCNNILAELNIASEKMREQLRYMQHRQLVISAKETQIKVKEYDAKLVEMAQGKSMEFKFVRNENLIQSLRSFTTMGGIKKWTKKSIAAKVPMSGLQGLFGLGKSIKYQYGDSSKPFDAEDYGMEVEEPMNGPREGLGQDIPPRRLNQVPHAAVRENPARAHERSVVEQQKKNSSYQLLLDDDDDYGEVEQQTTSFKVLHAAVRENPARAHERSVVEQQKKNISYQLLLDDDDDYGEVKQQTTSFKVKKIN